MPKAAASQNAKAKGRSKLVTFLSSAAAAAVAVYAAAAAAAAVCCCCRSSCSTADSSAMCVLLLMFLLLCLLPLLPLLLPHTMGGRRACSHPEWVGTRPSATHFGWEQGLLPPILGGSNACSHDCFFGTGLLLLLLLLPLLRLLPAACNLQRAACWCSFCVLPLLPLRLSVPLLLCAAGAAAADAPRLQLSRLSVLCAAADAPAALSAAAYASSLNLRRRHLRARGASCKFCLACGHELWTPPLQ
jgi:hypothetical protein